MSGVNGTFRLIQNELIKIIRQTSWRIMTIILMVIVIGYPILVNLMSSMYTEDYEKAAESETENQILREYYLAKAETGKYFKEKGLISDNWQYARFYYEYNDVCESIRGLKLIAEENKSICDVLSVFFINGISREYVNMELTDNFWYQETSFNPDTGEMEYEETQKEFTAEAAAEILAEYYKKKEYIEEKINTPFSEYLKQTYSIDKEAIKAEYETAKSEYEKDPSNITAYDTARLRYECAEKLSGAIQKLISFSDGLTASEERTYMRILSQFDRYLNYEPQTLSAVSEKEFNEHYYGFFFLNLMYTDYDEYIKAIEMKQEELSQAEDLLAYSIENNVPIDYLTVDSARDALDSSLGINMTILMFFAIFMGAVIVSSEHSSGAVRLLLIRPRARWKILLSKIACLLIFLVAMTAVTSAVSLIETVILYGWNDLSVPYLMYSGGVKEVAPVLYYIYKNLVGILPSFLIMFFALFMSVITKKSVFALAISLLANVFGSTVSAWLYDIIRTSAQWLKLTPIPFFGLSDCFPDPIGGTMRFVTPSLYGITLEQGVLMMLIYTVVLIAASFVIFEKQQVK